MDSEQISVYFDTYWTDSATFLDDIRKQSPNQDGTWGRIRAVTSPDTADYHVAFDSPTNNVNREKLMLFSAEPPCIPRGNEDICTGSLHSYPLSEHHKPQRWFINKSYNELADLEPIEKTKDLSWITTDKGRGLLPGVGALRRQFLKRNIRLHQTKDDVLLPGLSFLTSRRAIFDIPTDGHILRMDFLDNLLSCDSLAFDLYGRGSFSNSMYQGEVEDKWTGLEPYRYTLSIENYQGANYFSEKVTDALLAWCMPIYWGCTNLGDFLPENSFVEIDIEDPNAPHRIQEIINSNHREENIGAIAEARNRLLNEYQIWPTVHDRITEHE